MVLQVGEERGHERLREGESTLGRIAHPSVVRLDLDGIDSAPGGGAPTRGVVAAVEVVLVDKGRGIDIRGNGRNTEGAEARPEGPRAAEEHDTGIPADRGPVESADRALRHQRPEEAIREPQRRGRGEITDLQAWHRVPVAVEIDHERSRMHAPGTGHRGVDPRLVQVPEGLERKMAARRLDEVAIAVEFPPLQPIHDEEGPATHPDVERRGDGERERAGVGVVDGDAARAGPVWEVGRREVTTVGGDEHERHRAVLEVDPGGDRQWRRRGDDARRRRRRPPFRIPGGTRDDAGEESPRQRPSRHASSDRASDHPSSNLR